MIRCVLAALLVLILFAHPAHAQSTAITYQGQLRNGGAFASGLHDFRFRLFDAMSGGTQVGATQCDDNVAVIGGLFTTTIDFGAQFATTTGRFLEIEVRPDTGLNCSNATGFVVLSLRQAITPTPRATAASVANALAAPDGSPANAVFVDNNGMIGIGTTTPGHSMAIAKPGPTVALQDTDSAGTAGGQQIGYLSYRDSGNVEQAWIGYGSAGDPDFSIINVRPGGDIVLNPNLGNVGIGTPSPVARLEVRGDIRLGNVGELFATGAEENLRIIRGNVSSTGAILDGTGFTVIRDGVGLYTITFTTPFSNFPTLTANGFDSRFNDVRRYVMIDIRSASYIKVRVIEGRVGDADGAFSFMVVGPR